MDEEEVVDKKKEKKEKGKFVEKLPEYLTALGVVAGAIWGSNQNNQNPSNPPVVANNSLPPSDEDKDKGNQIWMILAIIFIVAAIILAIIKYTSKNK